MKNQLPSFDRLGYMSIADHAVEIDKIKRMRDEALNKTSKGLFIFLMSTLLAYVFIVLIPFFIIKILVVAGLLSAATVSAIGVYVACKVYHKVDEDYETCFKYIVKRAIMAESKLAAVKAIKTINAIKTVEGVITVEGVFCEK